MHSLHARFQVVPKKFIIKHISCVPQRRKSQQLFVFQVCWHRWGEKPTAREEDDQGLDKEDVSP